MNREMHNIHQFTQSEVELVLICVSFVLSVMMFSLSVCIIVLNGTITILSASKDLE